MTVVLRRHLSFHNILLVSIVLRVALIVYSEWHDAHSVVKYTDVDYRVFSDATRFLLNPGPGAENIAKGPLWEWLGVRAFFGDPYTRQTYRYTPLLAVLLTPNEWLHPSFGKYLFAACDIINGLLIHRLLETVILPTTPRLDTKTKTTSNPAEDRPKDQAEGLSTRAALFTAVYLLNPLVFTISTRGSSESVLSLFVLLTLFCALKDRWDAAAILLGLSTHWKIYPVIYGVGCLGVVGLGDGVRKDRVIRWNRYHQTLINLKTIRFGLLSASTFAALGGICYLIWGYPFLYESYLYHLHRLDHRHNFSPYFYLIYLTYPPLHAPSKPLALSSWHWFIRSPLAGFVPQMVLALGTGFLFGRRKEDLVFTWFVQTVAFVLFNKVCTSQYFLWYILFLPLLLPRLSMSPRRSILYLATWIATQALWLSEAYRLEFLGEPVFYGLWVRSLLYVAGNVWILGGVMQSYAVSS